MHYTQVALELYTVRDETKRDFEGTLRQVAQMGYMGVEFAGYGNLSAQAMVSLLAETGLKVAGTHVGLDGLSGEKLDASISYCRAIGCPVMVLPSLAQAWRTLNGIRSLGPQLNTIGRRCRDAGIEFGYHNHDFEFSSVEGNTLLEHLLENTEPDLVKIELDVYWAAYAGHDPLALLDRLGERVALIHFKDMAADRSMTEVGQGMLDMQGITAFARQHGLWAVVEHDNPTLPSLESAKVSLGYFR
jgi:sugar phosphate isomerase/epimerase